jgi:hypothetical protein
MYKLYGNYIIRLADNAYIPISADNSDYQEYLSWVAASNTPLPADPPPPPPPPPGPSVEERLEAAEALIDMMLESGGEASNG